MYKSLTDVIELIQSGKKISASSDFIIFESPYYINKINYLPFENFIMYSMIRMGSSKEEVYKSFFWRYKTKKYMRTRILQSKMLLDSKKKEDLNKIWENFAEKCRIDFI